MSDLPILITEIEFTPGTFTEITDDLRRRFHCFRGRRDISDQIRPGEAELQIDDREGLLDPDNDASPHFPNVGGGLRFRARARVASGFGLFTMGQSPLGAYDAMGGGTQDVVLFTGKTKGGPRIQPYEDTEVEWRVREDYGRLDKDKNPAGFGSGNALTGTRINEVLDGSTPTWPQERRDIDPGRRTVQAGSPSDRLSYLFQVAESEGGLFFVSRDGKATFRDADYSPLPHPVAFGEGDGEHLYRKPVRADDESLLATVVTVTAPSLSDVVVEDVEAIGRHDRIDHQVSSLLSNALDMEELAEQILSVRSQPMRRIVAITLGEPGTDFYRILTSDLWRQDVIRNRPHYGGMREHLSRLEGIDLEVLDGPDWIVTLYWSRPPPVVPNLNLLTPNQSSIETDATGWTAVTNCTIARSTLQSYVGSASLAITTSGALLDPARAKTTPFDTVDVTVGETYRATSYLMAGGSFFGRVEISWRDGADAEVALTSPTATVIHPQDGWKQVVAEAAAPSGAVHAVAQIHVNEPYTHGNIKYADAISLRRVEE